MLSVFQSPYHKVRLVGTGGYSRSVRINLPPVHFHIHLRASSVRPNKGKACSLKGVAYARAHLAGGGHASL